MNSRTFAAAAIAACAFLQTALLVRPAFAQVPPASQPPATPPAGGTSGSANGTDAGTSGSASESGGTPAGGTGSVDPSLYGNTAPGATQPLAQTLGTPESTGTTATGATGAAAGSTAASNSGAGATTANAGAEGSANGSTPAAAPRRTIHDFLDTRLTWTFGDDDILTATGQRVPVSPLPRIGDRSQYQLFFDALNSRFAGRENLTHLAVYARAPGFIPRIQTEAALVLRVDLTQLTSGAGVLERSFYDAGTYLRIQYQTNLSRPTDGVSLTFFPFDTDRFRLGYLWDLSWGGNDIFPRRVGGAPGLRLGIDAGPFTVWAGFKTAAIVVPLEVVTSSADIEVVRVEETQFAGLGGVGIRGGDMFRFDASGGFFQQGRFDFAGIRGQPVYIFGGSARVVLNHNLAPPTSIDMMLYRNHPDFPMQLFAPERYTPGAFSWLVSLEGSALAQNLANVAIPGQTSLQPGFASALQGRIRYDYLSVGLTGLLRDVSFLLRNVPSFIPFQTIPTDATVNPELFFALSADYRIQRANLLPSIVAGLQFPATFSTTTTEGGLSAERSLVIRRAGNFSILPPGQGAVPIFSARASLRWDISSIMAGLVWIQYVLDNNSTLLQVDSSGTRQVRIFQAPSQLGFGVTVQARF